MNKPTALSLLLLLLAACSSNQAPPADPSPPTAIDSFGANPNPAPANIPVIFSWSVTGDDLNCAVDVDNNGSTEYTVQDCSSSSRIGHVYGTQGSFTAQLTVTGADGVTLRKTTAVKLEVENQAPSVLSFDVRQGSKENSLIFAWVVSDSGTDTLKCRLDADGDGQWESDRLCSATQSSGQVNGLATSSNQVEITLPTGSYTSIFEVYDAYSTTRISSKSRSPYNRLPQITSLKTTVASGLVGTVSFQVTDPDRDSMICSLTVQGVGQFVYKNCSSITRTYTFPKEGTYTVTLEVIDEYKGVASQTTEITFQSTPPLPVVLVQLAAGGNSTCGLLNSGTAYCWGDNELGQLGIGNNTDQNTPQAVSMPSGVTFSQLAIKTLHTCGLTSTGAAYCWGQNTYGGLGDGTTSNRNTPVAVSMPSGVTFNQLSAGQDYHCGLSTAGAAYCWGQNFAGGLGIGNTTDQLTPQAVSMPGGVTFTQLTVGTFFSCGLSTAGAAYCWGQNTYGQLGIGNNNQQTTPQAVSMPGGVTFAQLTAGAFHACGLSTAGAAYCWGANFQGRLGNGTTTQQNTPQAVSMPSGVTFSQISTRFAHTCALGSDSMAYCWGNNGDGQLGNGTTDSSYVPLAVSMPSGVTFSQISAGGHTCALGSDSMAYCWGGNGDGQLGNGTTDSSYVPVAVSMP